MTNPIKAQIEAKHYWIQKGTPDLIADDLRELEPYLTDRPAPIIHVVEHFPIVALLAQKDSKIEILQDNKKFIQKENDRLSKSYNFDQQLIRDQKAELDKLRECLAEVKSCKIGSVVIYNPNGEDKDAAFLVSLVQSVNAENEKLQSDFSEAKKSFEEMRKSVSEYYKAFEMIKWTLGEDDSEDKITNILQSLDSKLNQSDRSE